MHTPRRRHMVKSIARGSKFALVNQCFDDPDTNKYLIQKIERLVQHEVKVMCSINSQSILLSKNPKHISWDRLLTEMKASAPVLTGILMACTRTKTAKSNRDAIVGTCAAILFQHRFPRMSLLQRLIAVILYAGHSSKQVQKCYFFCVPLGHIILTFL